MVTQCSDFTWTYWVWYMGRYKINDTLRCDLEYSSP